MNYRSFKIALLICREYIRRHQKVFITVPLIISVLIFVLIRLQVFKSTNSLQVGIVGTYQEHDIPFDVTRLLSKGLVEVGIDGRFRPSLAKSWEANKELNEFKFILQDNLTWSDGSTLIAADLVFAIPDTEVTVVDDKTITFKLKDSYAPFPSLLTKPLFKKGTLVGTGPYQIEKIEKSRIFITKLILRTSDLSKPELVMRFYPNERVAVDGFSLGEVSVLLGFGRKDLGIKNPQLKIKQRTDFSKVVVILYSTKDKVLSNRSLRQALSYIAPKISDEELAFNPFPPTSWAFDESAKKYLGDEKLAKEAMIRAESNIPEDQLRQDIVLTTTPNLESVARQIETEWKKLGLNINVRIESGVAQNFQSLLITQSIPLDPDQYFLWHSTQEKTNLTKYSSVRVDKDLEDGRKTQDEVERKKSYSDFQKTLLEDAPATFLYYPKYNIIYLKKSEKLLDKILSL